eukprot:354192-Chlamydomonas_euryale.AAC.6
MVPCVLGLHDRMHDHCVGGARGVQRSTGAMHTVVDVRLGQSVTPGTGHAAGAAGWPPPFAAAAASACCGACVDQGSVEAQLQLRHRRCLRVAAAAADGLVIFIAVQARGPRAQRRHGRAAAMRTASRCRCQLHRPRLRAGGAGSTHRGGRGLGRGARLPGAHGERCVTAPAAAMHTCMRRRGRSGLRARAATALA